MTEATKRPWFIPDYGFGCPVIYGGDDPKRIYPLVKVALRRGSEDAAEAKANAALIVKAVNLHDELVEALERIQTFNEAECDILGGIGDQVAAVLQKAREGKDV